MGPGAAVTRDGPGAAVSWEVGTGAVVTRGVPGAALRWEAGAAPRAALRRSIVDCFS
jgi:hypothetical protein